MATSSQQEAILRAIYISSSGQWGTTGQPITSPERQQAFQVLQDFSTNFDGRVPLSLDWLQTPTLSLVTPAEPLDVTMAAKLYACEIVAESLKKSQYTKWSEQDRLRLRQAVLVAAQHRAQQPVSTTNPLANKLASLLADLVVRDFPQRWTTCISDLFSHLWMHPNDGGGVQMGNRMCLQILQLVAEDCTDSDFNSKISTKRRNDILLGLNEVAEQFLPLLFHSLEQITQLIQARTSIHQMRLYLINNQQPLSKMTPEQTAAYTAEETKIRELSIIIADTLQCLEKFSRSMPLEWIMHPQHDFCAAFFHLMREPTEDINVLAVECLEQLALRGKLSYTQWLQWIQDLPQAVQNANQQAAQETEYLQAEEALSTGRPPSTVEVPDPLTRQLKFHRALSRTLAVVVSSHIALVVQDKNLLKGNSDESNSRNQNAAHFAAYLRLMVDILGHPSGRVVGEQLTLWTTMLRDPQISKSTNTLDPLSADILTAFVNHMMRIEWEDVEDGSHPQSAILQASWEDEEEYNAWANDYRSRSSQLFKYLGNCQPHVASSVLLSRLKAMLAQHGNGEPRDHLDPATQQLTAASEAVRQFESLVHPLENVLSGLPAWSLNAQGKSKSSAGSNPQQEAAIRAQTQASLSEIARCLLSWDPQYLFLKFRKVQLLECMKHYWKYEPSTLLQGIECFVKTVGAIDEWGGPPNLEADGSKRISGETISLRKKSSTALVAVSKMVPEHLVPWLSQLSDATRNLLSDPDLLQTNRMHLYEFLTVVATAVEDPGQRANFVGSVLADALNILESGETQEALSSVEKFLTFVGITQAATFPGSVTDVANVKIVSDRFVRVFSAFNELLSVGRRCHEAAKKRPNGGIPSTASLGGITTTVPKELSVSEAAETLTFPDEGPVSLQDLAVNDPFVHLWARILPQVLRMLDVLFKMWRPEWQSALLRNAVQRYALAISDDDAFLCRKNGSNSGGVFGEGGTAGSVIPGTDRREVNLAPKWSGWFSEFRNTLLQMLGLLAAQRALYSPEISQFFPQIVAVVVDQQNLRAMEHRHFAQYLKQFIEIAMMSCPPSLYPTHLAPIIVPVFEHIRYRLEHTWEPVVQPLSNGISCKPLFVRDCESAAALASNGGEAWYQSYYARSCLFVGDLDNETAEAAVEKYRVEFTRIFSDLVQSALALKGDWALVLANMVREEDSRKNGSSGKGSRGPPNRLASSDSLNADGTPKNANQTAIDARKLRRINSLNHFLFLENETVAGFLALSIIQCLAYPDTYTCRRITRICHRMLETVAWHPRYTELLGYRMLAAVTKAIVTEPKWMVGVEWDMINVFRDIYCRLVLGQSLQVGGQGAGAVHPQISATPVVYEQAKSADKPLQGGGILTTPSELPHQLLMSLPGISVPMVQQLDEDLKAKRAAKDQKDTIRDFLRVAADEWKENEHPNAIGSNRNSLGLLDRALAEESLLHNTKKSAVVEDIPEKLVTSRRKSRAEKAAEEANGLSAFSLT
ncbi:Exportin 1-like protein [Nitzschia inconspicua]|uniref:Exportin 1-like protein n=1 Tax=Nitzschia inconspicua TaxID=303405 RepID=A0A9K3LWQ0_9STRA|nr:Exportin 1-like protein [Nitzschia inconspicua]